YGIAVGGESGVSSLVLGGGIGLVLGIAVGVGIYWGLVSIPMRQLFTVTSWLVPSTCRRAGLTRRCLSDAGKCAARAREQSLGYVVPGVRPKHPRQDPAHTDRIYGPTRRHSACFLCRDPRRDRRANAAASTHSGDACAGAASTA